MELKDYLKIISRYRTTFLATILLTLIATVAFTFLMPAQYEAAASITVNKHSQVEQEKANYYQYDDFYSIQAAGFFADTIANWIASPTTVYEIYFAAREQVPDKATLKSLAKTFKTKKQTNINTVDISIRDRDKDRVDHLIKGAVTVVKNRTDELKKSAKTENFFAVVDAQPVIVKLEPNYILNTIIGLILGLILATTLVLGVNYFKE